MIGKISLLNTNNCNYKNKISFGSMDREVFKDKKKTVIDYRTTTFLQRPDINWKVLTKHITRDKNPKKIYCYACSDGSEPYSIAMNLIAKLGWKKAQKYFPIVAKDIDSFALKKAKCGFIDLTITDILNLNELQNSSKMKFMHEIKPASRYDEYSVYRVDDKLKSCINFSKGDLSEDVKSLKYDKAVVFFRNVWPYLSKEKINHILKTFSENFKKGTSLVIGSFDIENPEFDGRLDSDFKDLLFINNLWQVKPLIYQAHNLKNSDIVHPSKIFKILSNSVYEKYCYMLELLRYFITG